MRRRSLLKAPAFAIATLPFSAFALSAQTSALRAVRDGVTGLPLLKLPPDFSYRTLAWTGAAMPGGGSTPGKHDGMGWMQHADGAVLLRNHELVVGPRIAGDAPVYDALAAAPGSSQALPNGFPGFAGGVTGVKLDGPQSGQSIPLISGTAQNCAGGMTPWGSWLTCEEIVLRTSLIKTDHAEGKDHGYVFEVPAPGIRASAKPIVDMGLMRHEAAVVASDGNVYLTEDNGPYSGFFRMRPYDRSQAVGALDKGGKLQMLRARKPDGSAAGDLQAATPGTTYDADWVAVDNPDQDPERLVAPAGSSVATIGEGRSGPYLQGEARGGATFRRLEGCYYSDGAVYFTDTSGGPAGVGSLWSYNLKESTLQLIYTSPDIDESNHIDNVTVSDQGLIIACEDGETRDGGGARMQALAPGRGAVTVAENAIVLGPGNPFGFDAGDYTDVEWAGATFSSDGERLYANVQTPGITFEIIGPWDRLLP